MFAPCSCGLAKTDSSTALNSESREFEAPRLQKRARLVMVDLMSNLSFQPHLRIVLGPTNTGKTHLAMERLLAHGSGMIGLPLRLLAREVYDRCLRGDFGHVHKADLALITGEEKILPPKARYFICTTEAMPISREVEFIAIDECQLAADPERGHVFTDRILHARGTAETILLGAETMAPILRQLLGKVEIESRGRFSRLSWGGSHKLSRLPRRSAVAAFSADNVYAIAEVIRQQRGGAAVVMGGLSPRTRNAQVEMYQSGEVDFLVATDAIGMGLNMDVDHVAFAQRRKFDGRRHRQLSAAELAQIAGRAGRHTQDGSFGVTGDMEAFDEALIEQIETHEFEPVKGLFWRNPNLDFSSLEALLLSLEKTAPRAGLMRAPAADDQQAMKLLSRDPDTLDLLGDGSLHSSGANPALELLWQVAQTPDFRKTTVGEHSALIGEVFGFLSGDDGLIPESWMGERIERCDRLDGDLGTLSMRLAHIRTWTYIAQRNDWLADPAHWQGVSRSVEDRLSDALHNKLMGQFVDRKTSALMRRLAGREVIVANIEDNGDILVAEEYMGRLNGLHVERDPRLKGVPAGTARAAVEKAVGDALRARAQEIGQAEDTAFSLTQTGEIIWQTACVGHLQINLGRDSDKLAYLTPSAQLLADEALTGEARQRAETRLTDWVRAKIAQDLEPLKKLETAKDLDGLARGLAFQLLEHKGSLPRRDVADILAKLDQPLRASLRKLGVRFGFYTVFVPALLKPAPARLLALMSLLERQSSEAATPPEASETPPRDIAKDLALLPAAGLTSCAREKLPFHLYRAAGFYTTKNRAIRLDMLERLADLIRPALEQSKAQKTKGFEANEAMMSIMGCGADDLAEILTALGYQSLEAEAAPIAPEAAEAGEEKPASISSEDVSPEGAAPEGAAPETVAPAETASEEAEESAKASEPEAAKLVTLWRPARAKHNPQSKTGAEGGRKNNAKRKSAAAAPKARASHKPRRAEKQADPNSPFAVLKSLQSGGNE
jgi:ATP-dependent RNA helicase SUPV3L1/SUV3